MFVVVVEFAFLLISFLFSLMKSKQMAVRGPTGGGRPPATSFYGNPCIQSVKITFELKSWDNNDYCVIYLAG